MIPSTLMARSYRFAFVFAGQPQMTSQENMRFYEGITKEGMDLPSFEQKKNIVVLQDRGGNDAPKNVFQINVGHFQDKFRLFVFEDYPNEPIEIFKKKADSAWKIMSKIWPKFKDQLVLSEVTLRYTVLADGDNATVFLLNSCLNIPDEAKNALGRRIEGIGIRLYDSVLVALDEDKQPPLSNADFNVAIETLKEDPSRLYLQATAKWPSLPLPVARMQQEGIPNFLNPEVRKPSWYLENVEEFIQKQITNFLLKSKGKE